MADTLTTLDGVLEVIGGQTILSGYEFSEFLARHGWTDHRTSDAFCDFVMIGPRGDLLHYCDGDIFGA